MKLIMDYAKNSENKKALVGWFFEAENEQEEHDLGWIRDHIFWGMTEKGTSPKYSGRYDNEETGNTKGIGYEIPLNVKRCLTGELSYDEMSERRKTMIEKMWPCQKRDYMAIRELEK